MKASSKKVYMDLSKNKLKTAFILSTLLLTNIVLGIVIMMSNVLTPEVNKAYFSASPAEVMIKCSPYQNNILKNLKKIPEVEQVEGRAVQNGQIVINGEKLNTNFIVMDDNNYINTVKSNDGKDELQKLKVNELFLERATKQKISKLPGDTIEVIFDEKNSDEMVLKDYVYDASSEPYTLEGDVYAFINQDTYKNITGNGSFNEIDLIVKGNRNKAYNEVIGNKVIEELTASGITVYEIEVTNPNEFYATLALNAVNKIFLILGSLIIIMSCTLIINMFNSMMLQQIKTIGIMKSFGGSMSQISRMYYANILIIGVATYVLSLPASFIIAKIICSKLAFLFNVSLEQVSIPPLLPIVLFISTFIIPTIAVSFPIIKTANATVYDALNQNLKGGAYKQTGFLNNWIARMRNMSVILRYIIRNQMKNRLRTVLTIFTLLLASGMLMTSLNLQSSFSSTINKSKSLFPDAILTLDNLYDSQKLHSLLQNAKGIEQVECWAFQPALYIEKGGKNSKKVLLSGAEPSSKMFDKAAFNKMLKSGRLLHNNNKNEILISNHLLNYYPDLAVGDMLTFKINNNDYKFKIVGIISMFGRPESPTLFVDYAYLNNILAGKDKVCEVRLNTISSTPDEMLKVINNTEQLLNAEGIQVKEINTGEQIFEEFSVSSIIVIALLMIFAVFMLIVGTIGLTGTLSINVMERKSELGIMRAIGGTHQQINRFIIVEGFLLTSVAWIAGNLLSVPLSYLLAKILGIILFGSPAACKINPFSIFLGLLIALAISFIASRIPCRDLKRRTTREMLAYE